MNFLVSLMMAENAYQQDQAAAASEAARRLGAHVEILYAENDAITQSQQLLSVIQSSSADSRPDAILCQPVGTTLKQVAREAMARGIAWALLNREDEYVAELQGMSRPSFCITIDQGEIGRIQARQFGALLPKGGIVLYILGPSINPVFRQRTAGMESTKPQNIQITGLRGKLTEQSGYDAIASWLKLSTSRVTPVSLIAGQNDNMAIGARRAFESILSGEERERWCRLPFTGCDASPRAGQEWIRAGLLTASIFMPPTAGLAIETMAQAIQTKKQPPLRKQLSPTSFPPIESLPKPQA
ncbi:MAG: sugar ABC transporter substrate-binding protein [Candidatus Acidiferrales bacterium]